MAHGSQKAKSKGSRVETEEKPPYEASLILPGGKLLAGDIAQIAYEGIVVSFPEKKCPPIEQGELVRLAFKLGHTGNRNWIIRGFLRQTEVNQDRRLLRVRLQLEENFLRQLQPDDWTIFNRRHTFRVRPNPKSPLSVILQKEGGYAEGQVIDISLGGIGIQLESPVAETLSEGESIMLSLPIPGHDVPITIQGSIRYLKKERDSHRVGIAFSSIRDESFFEKEKAISRFVLTRQREIIGTVEGS